MKPSTCLELSNICQEHKETVNPVTHRLKLCRSIYMRIFSVNTVLVFSFYRSLTQLNVWGNLYLIRDHNMWNQRNQGWSSDSIQIVSASCPRVSHLPTPLSLETVPAFGPSFSVDFFFFFNKGCSLSWRTSRYELRDWREKTQRQRQIILLPDYTARVRINISVISISENCLRI